MAVGASPGTAPLVAAEQGFDWSLCRTFLAVARRGSIAAATAELGISHPAVRRQLDRLEVAMGAPLFSRSQMGMALTPLAEALLAPAQEMERSARSMVREATSTETIGLVRIAADALICAEVLPTVLLGLRRDRPGLRYDVAVGSTDLLRRDADIGLHFAAPVQDRVVASRIATFRSGLFASKSWLAANGELADGHGILARRALVGCKGDVRLGAVLGSSSASNLAVTVAEDSQVLRFVAMGLGVGMVPLGVARRHGALVRLLPEVSAAGEVWLSVHPDLRHVPHVRQVMDVLRDLTTGLVS